MESILSNFDIEKPKNFWKLYPSYKTPKAYREIYIKDKSKNKEESSLFMWALMHMYDKSEANPYRTVDSEDKKEIINEDILEQPNFDWSKYGDAMDTTLKLMYDEVARTLFAFESFLEKRRKFIEKEQNEITFSNIKELDEAVKRNEINMKELQRLRDAVENSDNKGRTRGNIEESLVEKGII